MNTEIRSLRESDIPYLMPIAAAELGSDYLEESDFTDVLDSDEDFCFVASFDDTPIGFIICNVLGQDRCDRVLHMPDCSFRDEVLGLKEVGYYASESIDDRYKGKGAGGLLIEASRKEFERREVKFTCAMAWKSVYGTVNIDTLLRRVGLLPETEFLGYWNDPREFPNGHDCPVCGNPCSCSAVYYVKRE